MARLARVILFIAFCYTASAQDSLTVVRSMELQGAFSDFAVDVQGNIYFVTTAAGIRKVDKNGDSVAVFNELRRYGKIHSIDVSNPFRILVYYKNTGTILLLDRLLAVRQVVDLRKLNMPQVRAVRLSYDNNIWLYDELAGRIRKIDENGKLLMESADLRNVFPEPPVFESITDADRSLYLYDITKGWYAFDYYGAFTGRFQLNGWKDAAVAEGLLAGRKGDCLLLSKPNAIAVATEYCKLPLNGALKTVLQQKLVYVLYPGRLQVFNAP